MSFSSTKAQLEQLAGLNIASHFFYQVFHQAPSESFMAALKDEQLMNHWPGESDSPESVRGLTQLKSSVDAFIPEKFDTIAQDYAALFVGPGRLKAAPWGSVYLTEEQTTCGESTLAIKAFYRELGIEIDTGENEPEDHIGLIFAFLAHLTDHALDAATGEEEQMQPWLCATKAFLTDHVLTWAPRFLDIMGENSDTPFYKGVSELAKSTLQQFEQITEAEYRIVRLYR